MNYVICNGFSEWTEKRTNKEMDELVNGWKKNGQKNEWMNTKLWTIPGWLQNRWTYYVHDQQRQQQQQQQKIDQLETEGMQPHAANSPCTKVTDNNYLMMMKGNMYLGIIIIFVFDQTKKSEDPLPANLSKVSLFQWHTVWIDFIFKSVLGVCTSFYYKKK